MTRPRTPVAVADITGDNIKHPARHAGRSSPKVGKLGSAPKVLNAAEIECWDMFADEMPWLGKSDRTIVTIAARLRSRMLNDPEMSVNALAQLRMCLSVMGGTPADRSKVSEPDEQDDDPAAEFIN